MPTLRENSPNTVYECLEHGIPFIASNVGGIPELVSPDDHARVLFEPTAEGVEAALRGVLDGDGIVHPVRAAFESTTSFERWAEVLELRPDRRPHGPGAAAHWHREAVLRQHRRSLERRCSPAASTR